MLYIVNLDDRTEGANNILGLALPTGHQQSLDDVHFFTLGLGLKILHIGISAHRFWGYAGISAGVQGY